MGCRPPGQCPALRKGENCPARCYKGLCLVDHGTPVERQGEDRAQRGTSWEGRKPRTGRGQSTWGAEVYLGYLEAGSDVET